MTDSEFSSNLADDDGGAINSIGPLSVTGTAFSGNSAEQNGGAINSIGPLSVTGSEFSRNSSMYGGAIRSIGSLSVTDSEFSDNSANASGAIYSHGVLSVTDSQFSRNSASWRGGAISSHGTLNVTGTAFSDNSADEKGGAIFSEGPLNVTGTAFSGNSAEEDGGAIYQLFGYANVQESSFSDNSPEDCVGVDCVSVPGGGRTIASTAQDPDEPSGAVLESHLGTLTEGEEYHEIPHESSMAQKSFPAGAISVGGTCDLADAITAANEDRAVGGCSAGNGADTIVLTSDITLSAELPPIDSEITLEGGGHAINGDDRYRIFFVNESGVMTIKGATLSNGRAQDGARLCRVESEYSDLSGGAICNSGRLSIIRSVFSGNSSEHDGGAILNGGNLIVTGSQFSDNSASSGGSGGAINSVGQLSVTESEFSDNSASWGGAIFGIGEVRMTDSMFSGNSAEGDGGAINSVGTLSVTGTAFSGNSAEGDGGAIYQRYGYANVEGSTFSENSPDDCHRIECVSDPDGGRILASTAQRESGAAQASVPSGLIRLGGACELADAITAANEDRAVGGCSAGDGADTIVLTSDITLSAELPPIDSEITLEGGGHAISGDDRLRIFFVNESGVMTIRGATLSNGRVQDGARLCGRENFQSDEWGGAICNKGYLHIVDSVISGNSAYGGGAIDSKGPLSVTDSVFSGNSSAFDGGAISSIGSLSVTNSEFSSNSVAHGGGAIASGGVLSVTNSEFSDNSAREGGGAILSYGVLNVRDGQFGDNSARSGGAIVSYGTLNVTGTAFSGNSAEEDGGAIYQLFGYANVQESSFSDNSPEDCAGADCVSVPAGGSAQSAAAQAETSDPSGTILESHRGMLAQGDEYHEIPFPLLTLVGKTISIQMIARDGDLVPGVAFWRGGEIARDDNPDEGVLAQLESLDLDSGEYVISIWSVRGRGSYELRIIDGAPPVSEPGPITLSDDCSLEDAIIAANADVAVGGCPAGNGADTIALSEDIMLAGADRRVRSEITIVGNDHTINGNGNRILVVAADGNLSVRNVTLTHGRADANSSPCIAGEDWSRPLGGAICNSGRLTVTDSTFSGNSAGDTSANISSAGAIYNFGVANVTDSEFLDNAASSGGALANEATTTVSGSVFSGNSSRLLGGAIMNLGDGHATVVSSEFAGNAADWHGGAIANRFQMIVENSRFNSNSALGAGAIYNYDEADLSVENSSFSNNLATGLGGGAILNVGDAYATVTASDFSGNNPEDCLGVDCGNAIQNEGVAYTFIRDAADTNNQQIIASGAFQRAYHLNIDNPQRLKDEPLKMCFPAYLGEPMGIWMLLDETRNPPELRTLFAWREAGDICVAVDRLGTIVRLRNTDAAAELFTSTNNWKQTRDALYEAGIKLIGIALDKALEELSEKAVAGFKKLGTELYEMIGPEVVEEISAKLPPEVFEGTITIGGRESVEGLVWEWSERFSIVSYQEISEGFTLEYAEQVFTFMNDTTVGFLGESAAQNLSLLVSEGFITKISAYFNNLMVEAFNSKLVNAIITQTATTAGSSSADLGARKVASGFFDYEGIDFDGIGGLVGEQVSDIAGDHDPGWLESVTGFVVEVTVGVATGLAEKAYDVSAGAYGAVAKSSVFAGEVITDIAVNAWMNEPLSACQVTTNEPVLARVTPKGFVRSVVPADATLPAIGRTAKDFKIYFYRRIQDVTAWIPVEAVTTAGDCGTGRNMVQRASDWISVVVSGDCDRADIETCG